MFVTNWISTTKIQKISEITNFFRHYFLSRTEVNIVFFFQKRCRIPMNATPFLTYFFISQCVFLVFIEKWLVLHFILCGYIFSHFLPSFGRSTAFF